MARLNHICPRVVHLGLRSRGQNAAHDSNKDYWPLENFKLGFEKLTRLKLHKIPIRPIEFKGLVGFQHSYSPNLVELELIDNFSTELLDLREHLVQSSLLTSFKMNQWMCCDQTFSGYFGKLRELKLSLKNFTFMKQLQYPSGLRVLEVQLEVLTSAFVTGIR